MILSLREKLSGVVAIAIIAIIAVPLAFFGVESLFLSGDRVNTVGSVNGYDITEDDLARSVLNNENRLRQVLGENFSEDLIDRGQLESQALQGLVEFKLYQDHAEDSGMGVTSNSAAEQIRAIPQFQIDGQFSEVVFRRYITDLGYTGATFLDAYQDDVVAQQLMTGIQTSSFATESMLQSNIAISQEKRSYQTILLPVTSVLDGVNVPEADIEFYYQENPQDYQRAEQASLDYLVVSAEDFITKVEVNDAEIVSRFDLMKAAQPARREAAHILVSEAPEDAHIAVLDQIQARLEEGAEFGDLAAEYSDDPGSASNQGVLGFTNGDIFPAEFEAALAELNVGEVSAPVLTSAGFHIIKLLGVEQEPLDLEAERAGIDEEIRREKATEAYRASLDSLRDITFSSESLEEIIAGFSDTATLSASETSLFDRQSGEGIAAQESVRTAAFSSVVMEEGLLEMVETSETQTVIVKLKDQLAAGLYPLEDVRENIVDLLKIQGGTALLEEKAKAIVARLEAGEESEDVAAEETLEWQVQIDATRGVAGSAGQVIFATPLNQPMPIVSSSVLPSGDYLIYVIDGVAQGSLDEFNELQKDQLALQLGQAVGSSENLAYAKSLRANAKIKMKIDVEY